MCTGAGGRARGPGDAHMAQRTCTGAGGRSKGPGDAHRGRRRCTWAGGRVQGPGDAPRDRDPASRYPALSVWMYLMVRNTGSWWLPGVSLTGKKKKCSGTSLPKKARGHSMCSTMVGGNWRLAVGGGWRLAVGNWRLAAVGGWQLATGGWWRLVVVGGGWWRLAVDGSWRLAVGGPLGRSLRAVLSKKKKSRPLRTPLVVTHGLQRFVCWM